jgi:hypothetical protein
MMLSGLSKHGYDTISARNKQTAKEPGRIAKMQWPKGYDSAAVVFGDYLYRSCHGSSRRHFENNVLNT